MNEYTEVSRKALKQDRVAMCPCFGCKIMKRVKPLKFGFFGFGRHSKCKVHRIPLVYLDEKIRDVVSGALACLFDKAGLPPKELINLVKEKFPANLKAFVNAWVYSITIGRGAPIASCYLDAIASAYMSNLTKKQVKTLKLDISNKRKLIKALKDNDAIIRGIKEMAHQYARLLKHLRAHSEVLVDIRELKPISEDLRRSLEAWQNVMAKEEQKLWDIREKRDVPLTTVKRFYDESLNAGTCRCLLGLAPEKNKKRNITAFDRFSTYLEFWKQGLAVKFTKSDIQAHKRNLNNNKTSFQLDSKIEDFLDIHNPLKTKLNYKRIMKLPELKSNENLKQEEDVSDKFSNFLKNLITLLKKGGIIKDSSIKSAQQFLGSNIYSLRGDRKRYGTNIAEYILDQWNARVINQAKRRNLTGNFMTEFHQLFKNYYMESNYKQLNPIYRSYRILLYRIVCMFKKAELIKNNTLDNLVEKIGLDFRHTITDLKNDPTLRPTIIVFNNLKRYINRFLNKKPSSKSIRELRKSTFELIDEFIENFRIKDIHILKKLQKKGQSHRNDLIKEFIKRCDKLGNIKNISSLSYLLFKDRNYLNTHFLNKTNKSHKPELYILFRILLNTITWNLEMLNYFGVHINEEELLGYQAEIESIIKEFVFSNKFRTKYVEENFVRNGISLRKNYLYPEYDAIFAMWLTCGVYYDNSMITFEDVKNFFDFEIDPTSYLLYNASINIGSYILKKVYYRIKQLLNKIIIGGTFNNFNYSDKILIFHECFNQIYSYSRVRNIRVLPARYDVYRIFQNKYVITYHVVELLKRNLGMDILYFRNLPHSIFNDGSWVRHHFRYADYIIRYDLGELKSSKVKDILLSSNKYHSSYRIYERSKKGEDNIERILEAFAIFKNYSGKIIERKIIKVLESLDLNWLYHKWKSQGQEQFDLMLKEFNFRKEFLKDNSIEKFLKKYYKIIYDQYFNNYLYVKNNIDKFKGIIF
ncbi:MAG: hypothetical protein GF383_03625 [Candidatus Lokiarchaeota archaeon]|nr:hypothetical protein [Candidatus Lokiarchaeota archaeon]MBD3338760.1 hypothetical protein [Candidatus Lokiarchaeota archaeon]